METESRQLKDRINTARHELLRFITARTQSAHDLCTRLSVLEGALANPLAAEHAGPDVRRVAIQVMEILDHHLDDCEQAWQFLDERFGGTVDPELSGDRPLPQSVSVLEPRCLL